MSILFSFLRSFLVPWSLFFLLSGAADACVDEEAVVDLDVSKVGSINPCNDMVVVYAESLGVSVERRFARDPDLVLEYPFYFPTRGFLHNSRPAMVTYPIEHAVRLAAVLAVADETPPERRGAYQIFANYNMRRMLREDARKIAQMDLFFLIGTVTASTHPALDTVEKNLCFVKADMPTLTVTEVVEGKVYKNCLEEAE